MSEYIGSYGDVPLLDTRTNDYLIHIAAPPLLFHGSLYQRCMVCGQMLCHATGLHRTAAPGKSVTIVHYDPMALVLEEDGEFRFAGKFDLDKLPRVVLDHLCTVLVEQPNLTETAEM